MQLTPDFLPELAFRLTAERKRQGLSRTQAASVCDVSASFIRDAESDPARCSVGRLLLLIRGLGLTLTVTGWQGEASNAALSGDAQIESQTKSDPRGGTQ